MKQSALSAQLCQTICDPMDCSPPGSSVHGILQARILQFAAIPMLVASPGDSSQECTWVSHIVSGLSTVEPARVTLTT